MSNELEATRAFLKTCHPFDMLPDEELETLPGKLGLSKAKKGAVIISPGNDCNELYILRSGAVETRNPDGQLLARLSEGEAFGVHAMLNDCIAKNKVTALEDSVFHLLPHAEFVRLAETHAAFSYYFEPLGAERLRSGRDKGYGKRDGQLDLMSTKLADLIAREPVTVELGSTIQQTAQIMAHAGVSCALVTQDGALKGIVTDRDIRTKVVATGTDTSSAIERIMTVDPISLDGDKLAFDALLTMTRRNIHHLPIMSKDGILGVLTNTNLIQQQTASAVYVVGDIHRRTSFEGLANAVGNIPKVLLNLVEAGATANNVGHMITSISDATTVRLLQLAEEKLGPAPIPYLWLAAGSQARQEQTGVSDQDNALILHDDYDEAEHGEYFIQMANFVNDGLAACGYIYCPGEMMAKTDKWRQPLKTWKKYFTHWIDEPEPMALMLSSIFFDLRPIHGDDSLFNELMSLIMEKTKKNSLFISHMAGNALSHTPPLGFFRNFVLIRGGEHDHELDMKHNGVVPIIDIARVYALKGGISQVNTHDRLVAEIDAKVLSGSGGQDLIDAFEFISNTRLKHQAEQIRAGRKPDNFLSPQDLSQFERTHLKDAFSVVKSMQSAMSSSHGHG